MERDDRPSAASALAVAILEKRIAETGRLGIPSLGVELTRDDPLETGPSEPRAVGRTAASALAIMLIEDEIRKTGEVEFVGLGIKLTKDNLFKPEETGEVKTTEK